MRGAVSSTEATVTDKNMKRKCSVLLLAAIKAVQRKLYILMATISSLARGLSLQFQ